MARSYVSVKSKNAHHPHPPFAGIPRAFDERLAPYGGEFDVKRCPPGRAFDYRGNVGQWQQVEGLRGKC